MIIDWRMHYFPAIDNERRYKIKVKGEEEDISKLIGKIGNICGRPASIEDDDYNWMFYVYGVEPETKEKITVILNDYRNNPKENTPKKTPELEAAVKPVAPVIEKKEPETEEMPSGKITFGQSEKDEKSKPVEPAFSPQEQEEITTESRGIFGPIMDGQGPAAGAEVEIGKETKTEGAWGGFNSQELPAREDKQETSGFSLSGETTGEKQDLGINKGFQQPEGKPVENIPVAAGANKENIGLVPSYTFDNFVVGACNRFAHAAAQAVAKNPGKVYNPLFLYGGVGLGKTHLMHAIGHYLLEHDPSKKMLYITTEKFISEVIEAISKGTIQELREKYREIDLLMIDDIQFLAEAESTQEDFFHTFNVMHNNQKQIVITSDKPPKQLTTLEDRLKSRFEWGLIADVKSPDMETRIAILKNKDEFKKLELDINILQYIASRLKSNIRELEGFLKRIYAYSLMTKQAINLEMVKELMNDLLPEDEREKTAEQKIETQPKTSASPEEIRSGRASAVEKLRELAKPRVEIKKDEKPQTKESKKEAEQSGESLLTPMEVAYFFPKGNEEENKIMKEYFRTTAKKHKLMFSLAEIFDREYEVDKKINYDMFAELCKTNNIKCAIILCPPHDSPISHEIFSQEVTAVLENNDIAVQLVLFEDLKKEYKYLNLLLDMVLTVHNIT